MTKKKLLFGGETDWSYADLGSAIHTALRKACDSDMTTIAYNLVSGLDAPWTYVLKRWTCVLRGVPDDAWTNYTQENDAPDGIWKPGVGVSLRDIAGVATCDLKTQSGCAFALRLWCEEWSNLFAPDADARTKLDREHGDGFTSLVYALCGVLAQIEVGEWEHGLLGYVFYPKGGD